MNGTETWVVKQERYDPPAYLRLYGPFSSAEQAAAWAEAADLPDFHIALRVSPPASASEPAKA